MPIGAIAALVAKALLWLFVVFNNAAFFSALVRRTGCLDGASFRLVGRDCAGPQRTRHRIDGALRIGKIRRHGIPETLEAILLGRRLINPKVAILKPVS